MFIDFLIDTYSSKCCRSHVYRYCRCCECCAVNEYYYRKKCESIVEPKPVRLARPRRHGAPGSARAPRTRKTEARIAGVTPPPPRGTRLCTLPRPTAPQMRPLVLGKNRNKMGRTKFYLPGLVHFPRFIKLVQPKNNNNNKKQYNDFGGHIGHIL